MARGGRGRGINLYEVDTSSIDSEKRRGLNEPALKENHCTDENPACREDES